MLNNQTKIHNVRCMTRPLFILAALIAAVFNFPSQNVYADTAPDRTYTFTSISDSTYTFCNNSGSVPCTSNGYRYITFEPDSPQGVWVGSINHSYSLENIYFPTNFSYSFDVSNLTYFAIWGVDLQGGSLKVTLSANAPGQTPCPEPQDPNRSAIMQDFHDVFMNTFVGIIPISAIFFVVWFMVDLLSSLALGRGK